MLELGHTLTAGAMNGSVDLQAAVAQLEFVVAYSDAGALVKPLTDPPS